MIGRNRGHYASRAAIQRPILGRDCRAKTALKPSNRLPRKRSDDMTKYSGCVIGCAPSSSNSGSAARPCTGNCWNGSQARCCATSGCQQLSLVAMAGSAVSSLIGKRIVKKKQMRRSLHGAHMLSKPGQRRSMSNSATGRGDRSESQSRICLPCLSPHSSSAGRLTPEKLPVSRSRLLLLKQRFMITAQRC